MLTLLKGSAVAAGLLAGDHCNYGAVSGRWSNRVPVDSSCASL
ncbi:MAG TPA: hypothetical protein VFJ07_06550 [Streptosporangiaceae bacterium]|nr:hypothetical protein [Streptosporangiaceae bacterium]